MMKNIFLGLLVIAFTACENRGSDDSRSLGDQEGSLASSKQDESSGEQVNETPSLKEDTMHEVQFDNVVEFAKFCAKTIENGDVVAAEKWIDAPVMFSPYAFIDQQMVKKFTVADMLIEDETVYAWGIYDARGDTILKRKSEYLAEFVLSFNWEDEDVEVQVYDEKPMAYGSELHNVQEVFPAAKYVSFYKPPSKEGFLDWRALIFVIEEQNNSYQLKAIVNNQWTA
ncbi:hypothetical protein CW751_12920 [Brumimicrobium salinarum]|uniref:Lipoprotein n=1 Tax=Brumimicrobium salinarum TaxID=2058658 RepID=A0A2I0QZT0_9FLAO|nr:hypothetical protein [Brumimicrobium salinarum]PKR79852.1 hypothetical protein CW751_12920 [Brumimicrobium salinarum]